MSAERTRWATLAAKVISLSNSLLLFLASIAADHFAVRIATMRHVAISVGIASYAYALWNAMSL